MSRKKPELHMHGNVGCPCQFCDQGSVDIKNHFPMCDECRVALKIIIIAQRADKLVIYDHSRPECIWEIVKPKNAAVRIRELMTKYNKVRFATRPFAPGDSVNIKQN